MAGLSERPDRINLSPRLVNAELGVPYALAAQPARIPEEKTGVPVVLGTHTYA